MKMKAIVDEIKKEEKMSGYAVSQYARFTLGYPDKSSGACLARALERNLIEIVGTVVVDGVRYNLYKVIQANIST